MLNIDSIQNGIVIDHIEAGKGMKIYDLLELGKLDCCVAIIKNARSTKMGRKDIIKIEGDIDINFDVLGFIDNNITVCTIKDSVLVDKKNIVLPAESLSKPARTEHGIDKAKVLTMCDERVTFTEDQIKAEASRCLSCGRSVVDPNKCIGCGVCTTKCEFNAIKLHRERPECSNMIPSEKKLPYVLGNGAKQALKIKFSKKKEK
jgi:aspartate carbamoyltransferase regulatory subunit